MPSEHTLHIPVMGTGFTNDTPLKVAAYGLSSVISLVDDLLLEQTREHYCREGGEDFEPIGSTAPDGRARRITAFLNYVDEQVRRRVAALRQSSFDRPDGIRRYFELLPDTAPSRRSYRRAQAMPEGPEKRWALDALREQVVAGSIDVNIMTKVDGDKDERGALRPAGQSDALAALRGFARSTLSGAVIFSAGVNPRLFAQLAELDDFYPKDDGTFRKRITLKVSDFRSALIQGKMLARRGLWVSEYRIESGLNCGGHAFPTDGVLLGPILEEFRTGREQLTTGLLPSFERGLRTAGRCPPQIPPTVRITVQGGIGTASEDAFLREHYGLDGTGWGSPFLMVPEVTAVDRDTRLKLLRATPDEVALSWSSPLGVRFWTLTTSDSEQARRDRIAGGLPGAVCTKRYLALNDEFGEVPLCPGSRVYQKRKLRLLESQGPVCSDVRERLQAPACICTDLGGSFQRLHGIDSDAAPAICPGPNLLNFQREMTLEELLGHIYGRTNVLCNTERPHMFLGELRLYLNYLREQFELLGTPLEAKSLSDLQAFAGALLEGITYYEGLAPELTKAERDDLAAGLSAARAELDDFLQPGALTADIA